MQAMQHWLSTDAYDSVLFSLWGALESSLQSLVLSTSPPFKPLSTHQLRLLPTISSMLHDRLVLEHSTQCLSSIPRALDTAAALSALLCRLAIEPTDRLHAEYRILSPDAIGEEVVSPTRRLHHADGSLKLMHVLQLLRQRKEDPLAISLLAQMEQDLSGFVAQVRVKMCPNRKH
jgi:hypothetical protein